MASEVQEYLDENYDKKVTEIDISSKGLTGALSIKDYPQLKQFTCASNYITTLTISGCPQLIAINCGYNSNTLTNINLTNGEKVTEFRCYNNYQLTNLEFLAQLNPSQLTVLNLSGIGASVAVFTTNLSV